MASGTIGDGWTCVNCGQYVWWNQNHNCPAIQQNYWGTYIYKDRTLELLVERDEARTWARKMYKRWLDEEEKRLSVEIDAREWEAYGKRADEEIEKLKTQLAAANAEIEALKVERDDYHIWGLKKAIERDLAKADDSTVICPKCGTEFVAADGNDKG